MTVFDEMLSKDEYSDMEFEEFLEFVVRIAFLENSTLELFLKEMFEKLGEQFIE